ncbi:MAG: hypothetical protein LBU68_01400 [Rickettsiales bacterium]|jgi:hypothetical protein|nr:hypothetical protein [Rickettsiales bacterium]
MHNRNKKSSKILHSGAMLLEAILVVGVLMMSLPMIMQQVNRRNETFENLIVANEIKTLVNAASGLVVFDKDLILTTLMPDSPTFLLEGQQMINLLIDYGLPDAFALENIMGLTHGVLLHKLPIGDHSESVPVADRKWEIKGYVVSEMVEDQTDENYIKVNDILNTLGWNAAFKTIYTDPNDEIISNLPIYTLDTVIKDRLAVNTFIVSLEQKQNIGDYMAKDVVEENETYNTMMTVLNMNNFSIKNVQDISGFEITAQALDLGHLRTFNLETIDLSGNNLTFNSFQNMDSDDININATGTVYAGELDVIGNVEAKTLDVRGLVITNRAFTRELLVANTARINQLGYTKLIQVDILRLYNEGSTQPIYGQSFAVTNGVIVTSKLEDELADPEADTNSAWLNQTARISPGDASNIVQEIMFRNPDTGITEEISTVITEQVRVLKKIMNEAIVTWPDFSN